MTMPDLSATDVSSFVGTWTLDPTATSVAFTTKAMWGLVKVKGTMKATEGSATVSDDGAVGGSLVLDASSIDTGIKKRDDHLRTADFFEVESHPTMTFHAGSVIPKGDGTFDVQGTFTVHGEARPLGFTASAKPDGEAAIVSAEFEIDRSKWGIDFAKMGAKFANHVVVKARFTKTG